MFMLLALGLLGVVDCLVLCQNSSMAKTLNISLSVFTGRSRLLKGCDWASPWSTVKPRMLNQTWWMDVIPRPWSKTLAPFIQALRYHVRISPQKTNSKCFIVFHPIPYLLFSCSANSQRKTPNNCGWRCRWTNCHHSGEFKMIGISSGQCCFSTIDVLLSFFVNI